jgi:multicomponent Na+:H+ antiporter subunit E
VSRTPSVEFPVVHHLRGPAVFLLLFLFWLLLSGHYDALHIGLGVVCSALVAFFSADLLFRDAMPSDKALRVWRFLRYIPWLLYEVVVANLHVVYLVIFPSKIRPQVVRFKTRLTGELAQVALGNSITLTPGTITMDIDDGEFCVHALSDKVAKDLLTGEMERRVAHVFLEPEHHDAPPSTRAS